MRSTNPIARLFARSPFRAMQEHVQVVLECTQQALPLFEALRGGDDDALEAVKIKIDELEQQADDVKNEIRSHLPKSLFMPVDRRDLLDILNRQDSIADTLQDVAGLLVMRKMVIPDFMTGQIMPYVQRNVDAVAQCSKVVHELDELLEMGFRGRAGEKAEEYIDELGRIETEIDEMAMDLTRQLFQHEDSMKPLSVIFWHQLIDQLADISDYAEDVGDRLRLLIAR